MSDAAASFLALVARLQADNPALSAVGAGLLAAAHLGIARDSRTFANRLGLAHALVLRELTALAGQVDVLRIDKRDARTLRTQYGLGEEGRRLTAFLP